MFTTECSKAIAKKRVIGIHMASTRPPTVVATIAPANVTVEGPLRTDPSFELGEWSAILDVRSVTWDEGSAAVRETVWLSGRDRPPNAVRGDILRITGSIRPAGDPKARTYLFDLESRGAILAPSDTNVPPIVADIAFSGKADLPGNLVTVDNAAIVTPGGSLAAAGTIGIGGDAPALAVAVSATQMDVAVFKQMWVPFVAPGATCNETTDQCEF